MAKIPAVAFSPVTYSWLLPKAQMASGGGKKATELEPKKETLIRILIPLTRCLNICGATEVITDIVMDLICSKYDLG